jgi:hypothetical protein
MSDKQSRRVLPVLWVTFEESARRFAFSYDHDTGQIVMKENSTHGQVAYAFDNDMALAELKGIFERSDHGSSDHEIGRRRRSNDRGRRHNHCWRSATPPAVMRRRPARWWHRSVGNSRDDAPAPEMGTVCFGSTASNSGPGQRAFWPLGSG